MARTTVVHFGDTRAGDRQSGSEVPRGVARVRDVPDRHDLADAVAEERATAVLQTAQNAVESAALLGNRRRSRAAAPVDETAAEARPAGGNAAEGAPADETTRTDDSDTMNHSPTT